MNGNYSQLTVFPEGFTTNNTHLIPFKKGAFVSELPVQPLVFKYGGFPGKPSMDCLDMLDNVLLTCFANLVQWQTRYVLPPVIPNEFMFEKFKNKGKDRAYVYAWVTRDIMSKASGLPTDDEITLERKEDYRILHKLRKSR